MIDAVGSDYTVTLNTAIIIEDFTLNSAGATVNHTSNIFRVTSVAVLLAGTFQLNGGTIQQGVWNLSGGQLSLSNNRNNRLDAVALNGDVNLTGSAHRVRLLNGASFTGDAMLSGTSAVLGYEQTGLLDNKSVIFDGITSGNKFLSVENDHTLTLGSQMMVEGGRGFVGRGTFTNGIDTVITKV